MRRTQLTLECLHDPPVRAAVDPKRRRPRANVKAVPCRVVLQVAHEIVAADPPAVTARDPVSRQAGEQPRRVKLEPVVARAPRSAGLRAGLENDRADTASLEQRRDRETSRAGADNDHVLRGAQRPRQPAEALTGSRPRAASNGAGQPGGATPTCSRIVSSRWNEDRTCSRASSRAPDSLPAASAA